MTRKRLEYFYAGVELVWIVDCVHRSVAVYQPSGDPQVLSEQDTITGGDALPGLESPVADFFSDLDIGRDN